MSNKTYSQDTDTPLKTIERVRGVDGEYIYILNEAAMDQMLYDIITIEELGERLELSEAINILQAENLRSALSDIEKLNVVIKNLEEQRDNNMIIYNVTAENYDQLLKDLKKIKRTSWFKGFGTGLASGLILTLLAMILLA